MRVAAVVVAVTLLSAGCATRPTYNPATACRTARAAMPSLQRGGLSNNELMQTVASDPRAYKHAKAARDQGIVWTTMTVLGAGLLLSGLLMGFVTDPSQTEIRAAGYGVAVSAIGLGAVATAVAFTGPREQRKAVRYFLEFAENCREYAPTELPPPPPEGTPLRPGGPVSAPDADAPQAEPAPPGGPRGEVYTPPPPPPGVQ